MTFCVKGCFGHVKNCISPKELQDREQKYRQDHRLWFDVPAQSSDTKKLIKERDDALRSREMYYQLGFMDTEGDWIDFPLQDILRQFTTLKEGILRGVFRQKAAGAWFGCRAEKAQITVLLPGGSDLDSWLDKVDCMSHSWPKMQHRPDANWPSAREDLPPSPQVHPS